MRLLRGLFYLSLLLPAWAWPGLGTGTCGPKEELVSLVPEEAGLCLLLEDLRGHAQKLGESGLVRKVLATPVGKEILRSKEAGKLQVVEQALRRHLRIGWRQLRMTSWAIVSSSRTTRTPSRNKA